MNVQKETIPVSNMQCTSCESIIYRQLIGVKGIISVRADYVKGVVYVEYDKDTLDLDYIIRTLEEAGYAAGTNRKMGKMVGLVLIVAALIVLNKFAGSFNIDETLKDNVTYLVLFTIGLFTSLHCVGMCGGLLLSQSMLSESQNKFSALLPSLSYNLGRVLSYTLLGGIVGAVGSVISLSVQSRAGVIIFAGLFMIFFGLNMSGFNVFRKLQVKWPWGRYAAGGRSKTPFVVGILNGLMPCGPLQTMQLYALGTGSAMKGAAAMFIFSLGTVPLMLAFGSLAGFLSKGFTKKLVTLSGVLVIVLGLVMTNRGLALAGLSPSFSFWGSTQFSGTAAIKSEIANGIQTVRIAANNRGYVPNVIFVQKGIPVKWVIDGEQINSCNNEIIVPALNIKKKLRQGEQNVVEFTPQSAGDIKFSCWMGMIPGVIKVVDDLKSVDVSKVEPLPSAGGCGNGCSMGQAQQYESIYGNDLSKVPTQRLIRKAIISKDTQGVEIKGIGYEFSPLVVVLNKELKGKITFDFSEFYLPEGKYAIVNVQSGEPLITFTGKKENFTVELKPLKAGIYAIVRDGNVFGAIDVVDELKTVDLEEIRKKVFP